MDSSKLSSSSNSSSGVVTQWPKSEGEISAPVLSEPVAIGDGVVIIPLQERGTRGSRAERQPLAPVQSSQKRKRDRPSLDGEDEDTHHNIENKKPRVARDSECDNEIVVSSSDEEEGITALPLASPPSIDSVLSPWDEDRDAVQKREHTTPHANRRQVTAEPSTTTSSIPAKNSIPCYVSPSSDSRPCPLPALSWADPRGVWKSMCRRDGRNLLDRHPNMLDRHPGILKKMRAILLDWLIEVCEVYKLHRETYHLAMDYLDRYLSRTQETCKTQLQLIGITCLFIAAKMEEIYPPKIAEFAYVTDGACDEGHIQMQELGILQVLDWKVNTITAIGWLGIYLQVDQAHRREQRQQLVSNTTVLLPPSASSSAACPSSIPIPLVLETPDKSPTRGKSSSSPDTPQPPPPSQQHAFEFPQFSGYEFTQVAQLMDLCSLDVELTSFPYSVVAAAAICHLRDRQTALAVSGLSWESIAECVQWMAPFHAVILEDGAPLQLLEQNEHVPQNFGLHAVCPNLTKDDSYKVQVHTCNLDMFDKVIRCREEASSGNAVVSLLSPGGMLTPPASSRKSLDAGTAMAVSGTKPT